MHFFVLSVSFSLFRIETKTVISVGFLGKSDETSFSKGKYINNVDAVFWHWIVIDFDPNAIGTKIVLAR